MPVGSFSALPYIIKGILATNPKSILDMGIGYGMNGACVRNWLEVGNEEYQVILEGIEGFKEYKNPMWDLYDKVHLMDILKFIKKDVNFDLIILTDVIEHFDKETGVKVLEWAKVHCNKAVMVSTPAIPIEQGPYKGNEFEAHKSSWTLEDFTKLGFGVVKDGKKDKFGHLMLVVDYIKK